MVAPRPRALQADLAVPLRANRSGTWMGAPGWGARPLGPPSNFDGEVMNLHHLGTSFADSPSSRTDGQRAVKTDCHGACKVSRIMASGQTALLGVASFAVAFAASHAFAQGEQPPGQPAPAQPSRPAHRSAVPYELPPPFQAEAPPRVPQPETIPDGYHAESRVRQNLVVGGSLIFGLPYLGSVWFGMALAKFQAERGGGGIDPALFFVPVVGPFVALGACDEVEPLLLLDGIAQATGAAMIVLGVAWKKTVVVPNTSVQVVVAPMRFGRDGSGLALAGTF
jgi:hypothetical protein